MTTFQITLANEKIIFQIKKWDVILFSLFILVLGALGIIIIAVSLYAGGYYDYQSRLNNVSQYTTTLPNATLSELCNSLGLDLNEVRCRDDVYAVELYAYAVNKYGLFTPRMIVDNEIGKYLVECQAWRSTPSDGVYQDCVYDFRGDGVYVMQILFQDGYPKTNELNAVPDNNLVGQVWRTEVLICGVSPSTYDCRTANPYDFKQ